MRQVLKLKLNSCLGFCSSEVKCSPFSGALKHCQSTLALKEVGAGRHPDLRISLESLYRWYSQLSCRFSQLTHSRSIPPARLCRNSEMSIWFYL
jgi:hypothetical protein